jgi:hypothetical protein
MKTKVTATQHYSRDMVHKINAKKFHNIVTALHKPNAQRTEVAALWLVQAVADRINRHGTSLTPVIVIQSLVP